MDNRIEEYTKQCFTRDPEDDIYYKTFFEMCRKFNIRWPKATAREREFITEVTRVTYEVNRAKREGRPITDVKPSFSA